MNETPGVRGELTVDYDIATGRAIVHCTGFWSVEQTRAYLADWRAIVHRIHAGGGRVSALVDISEGAVQKAEVAALLATGTDDLYRDGDAVAMVVPTSLAKMQARRVLNPGFHGFFVSRHAAETWLTGRLLSAEPLRRAL